VAGDKFSGQTDVAMPTFGVAYYEYSQAHKGGARQRIQVRAIQMYIQKAPPDDSRNKPESKIWILPGTMVPAR
jgi:hypothetical protein